NGNRQWTCSSIARFLSWLISTGSYVVFMRLPARGQTRDKSKRNCCPESGDWNTKDEHYRFAGRQCLPQWLKRRIPELRVLLHSAQKSDGAPQLHDRGGRQLDSVSLLLYHLPRVPWLCVASGTDNFPQSGLVPPDLFEHFVNT